jgi:hypothetical protein
MKSIACRVGNHPALIVGYAPGRKGKVRAVVITQGVLKDVSLKNIQLVEDLPPELRAPQNVVVLTEKRTSG